MARRRSTSRGRHGRWSELAGKPRWTVDEARTLLSAAAASGLPLSAFARQHGLPLPRLYNWRVRLGGKSAAGVVAARFLPVRIVSAGGAGPAQPSGIEIELGDGRRIRVAETFDPAALARVIEVLERPTC